MDKLAGPATMNDSNEALVTRWNVLPVSALIELTAVALFAINLIATFARPPVVVTSALTMTTE